MRRAFSLAIYHAHQRHVFGNPLIQQPLMRHVLSRMALQLEGQTALLFRLAAGTGVPMPKKSVARLLTPAAKCRFAKEVWLFRPKDRGAARALAAMESELPRLYRDAW